MKKHFITFLSFVCSIFAVLKFTDDFTDIKMIKNSFYLCNIVSFEVDRNFEIYKNDIILNTYYSSNYSQKSINRSILNVGNVYRLKELGILNK